MSQVSPFFWAARHFYRGVCVTSGVLLTSKIFPPRIDVTLSDSKSKVTLQFDEALKVQPLNVFRVDGVSLGYHSSLRPMQK
jgi:hypothetical protein